MAGRKWLIGLAAVASMAGCAAHGRSPAMADRFTPGRPPGQDRANSVGPPSSAADPSAKAAAPVTPARPEPRPTTPSIEGANPELAAALLATRLRPGAEAEREAARQYLRLGVLDAAFNHLGKALRFDPTDAAAHDGLARVWRDWGFPNQGLREIHRALYYAPTWAAAHNTLGTILLALDQFGAAERTFERARSLDPESAYLLNNLCYARLVRGDASHAIEACRQALALDPGVAAARNNLALALAAAGDYEAAEAEFGLAPDQAASSYNRGIVDMARRRYAEAADAFETAARLRPGFLLAHQRAAVARRLLEREKSGVAGDDRR